MPLSSSQEHAFAIIAYYDDVMMVYQMGSDRHISCCSFDISSKNL